MGYPKQPGQDAEAHRRATERCLSQARHIDDLGMELAAAEERQAEFVAKLDARDARIAELEAAYVVLQKHRDAWRSHAYGRRGRPDDFLDGNMGPEDRGPTCAERVAELEALVRSAYAEGNNEGFFGGEAEDDAWQDSESRAALKSPPPPGR